MQRAGAARRRQNYSRENNQRCRQFKRDDFASRARREDQNYQRIKRRKLEERIVDECADGAARVFGDFQCLHGGCLQHACFRIRSNIKCVFRHHEADNFDSSSSIQPSCCDLLFYLRAQLLAHCFLSPHLVVCNFDERIRRRNSLSFRRSTKSSRRGR